MFEVKQCRSYKIVDGEGQFLHSDGDASPRGEYWPTEEQAQAVLDKYRPKHVWKHGDVFKRKSGIMLIYLVIEDGPLVYCLRPLSYNDRPNWHPVGGGDTKLCLVDATFLFNIKDKL